VDVLSNPGYRGIHRDQRRSADHSSNQSVAVWDILVVFQYPTRVRSSQNRIGPNADLLAYIQSLPFGLAGLTRWEFSVD